MPLFIVFSSDMIFFLEKGLQISANNTVATRPGPFRLNQYLNLIKPIPIYSPIMDQEEEEFHDAVEGIGDMSVEDDSNLRNGADICAEDGGSLKAAPKSLEGALLAKEEGNKYDLMTQCTFLRYHDSSSTQTFQDFSEKRTMIQLYHPTREQ